MTVTVNVLPMKSLYKSLFRQINDFQHQSADYNGICGQIIADLQKKTERKQMNFK